MMLKRCEDCKRLHERLIFFRYRYLCRRCKAVRALSGEKEQRC